MVRRIVEEPATDQDIDRILDHILGPIYYRLLLTGDRIDDEYLWELVLSVSRLSESTLTNKEEIHEH